MLLWTCAEMYLWNEISLKPRLEMQRSGVFLLWKEIPAYLHQVTTLSEQQALAKNITYDVCRNSLIITRNLVQKTQPSKTLLI